MKSGEPRDKKCHKTTFRLFNFEILLWALGTLVFLKLSFWFKIILYFSSGLWTRSVRPIFFLNEPCLFRVFEICEITVVGEKKSPLADAKSELLLPISNRLRQQFGQDQIRSSLLFISMPSLTACLSSFMFQISGLKTNQRLFQKSMVDWL